MEKLLDKKDYETAAKIADSIDWRKVRNVGLLMEVAEAYEYTERFEDCYEILNIAYDCAPIGRMIIFPVQLLFQLFCLYLKFIFIQRYSPQLFPHILKL